MADTTTSNGDEAGLDRSVKAVDEQAEGESPASTSAPDLPPDPGKSRAEAVGGVVSAAERRARRAEALRSNLRRRKHQKRSRTSEPPESTDPETTA